MKDINEIEKLTGEPLEAASISDPVNVPSTLQRYIETALIAEGLKNAARRRKRNPLVIWGPAFIAAAAGLSVLFYVANTPEDTFSDPEEAYAQIESTFRYIQSKAGMAYEITDNALNFEKQ